MVVCPRCSEENPARARFCLNCGVPLDTAPAAPDEERKVVTVLFADVVGFTSIAERLDPEEVRALLAPLYSLLRATLTRYGGSIEQFTGDGVMALFGAPIAHGDDPERAVRAALAIRDAVVDRNEQSPGRELDVRIGINTGTVIVAHDSAGRGGERIVAGDAVNVASRLQTAAPVNGILVGDITHRATASVIDYRELGPIAVKGKSEPVDVWEALAPRARFGVDIVREARVPIVGRDVEVALLTGLLDRVRSSREPQFVTLVGEPGVGKSRLLLELFNHARRVPELMFWRQGRSLPYGEQSSFWALGEIVKAQAGILETDSAQDAGEKLRVDLARRHEDEPWVESHLRPLVGIGGGAQSADRIGESYAAWLRWVEALAADQPLVLVFEDLHWADDELLEFVDQLAERMRGVPLLVVCTARPELLDRRPSWGGGKRNATTISLLPLSDAETAELVIALLGRGLLPDETLAQVVGHAGGNPFFAEEYLRMFQDRGFLRLEDGVWRLQWLEDGLPVTVQGIIAARIDALGADEKALLLDASVVGKVFWLGALTQVSGMTESRIRELLLTLEQRELIRPERRASLAGEAEYGFRHALVRDVAYALIPRARRAAKHCDAARWTETLAAGREDLSETRANHYRQALEYAEDTSPTLLAAARQSFVDAGDRAARLSSHGFAVEWFERALDLTPRDDAGPRGTLLMWFGRSRFRYDRTGLVELERARELLLQAGDRERAAEASVHLGLGQFASGQAEAAIDTLERAAELVRDLPPSRTKVRVYSRLSSQLLIADRADEAIEFGRRALMLAEELGDEELRAASLRALGTARAAAGDAEGLTELEEGIAAARALGSFEAVPGMVNLAATLFSFGDLRRAFELEAETRELAARYADAFIVRWLRMKLSAEHYWRGRWDECLECVEDLLVEGANDYAAALARMWRAKVRLARGDVAGALEDSALALTASRAARDSQLFYPALGLRAQVVYEAGREDEAAAAADELLGQLTGTEMFMGHYWVDLAFVLAALGRGRELLDRAEGVVVPTRWLDVAEAVARGDLAGAADLCAEMGALPYEAQARLAAGQRDRAVEFFRAVGADAALV